MALAAESNDRHVLFQDVLEICIVVVQNFHNRLLGEVRRPTSRDVGLHSVQNVQRVPSGTAAGRHLIGFGEWTRLSRLRANGFTRNGNPSSPDDFFNAKGLEQLNDGLNLLDGTRDFNRIRRRG